MHNHTAVDHRIALITQLSASAFDKFPLPVGYLATPSFVALTSTPTFICISVLKRRLNPQYARLTKHLGACARSDAYTFKVAVETKAVWVPNRDEGEVFNQQASLVRKLVCPEIFVGLEAS